MFLDQMQNQVATIYMRCSQMAMWLLRVKDYFLTSKYEGEVNKFEPSSFNTLLIRFFKSGKEKKEALRMVQLRIRVLLSLLLVLGLYSYRKRAREKALAKTAQRIWAGVT